MPSILRSSFACALAGAAVVAGCGSSTSSQSSVSSVSLSSPAPSGGSAVAASSSTQSAGGSSGQGGALSADSRSAATGDIPDNQVFLVFTNPAGGFSIKYPEGWTRSGPPHNITFRDKNNLVRVLIARGPAPTLASVATQLNALKQSNPTLAFHPPQTITIGSTPVVKAVYTTESAPNPVTGKRVKLIVDRYELIKGGRVATVDLGTPVGVDNVDAYRKMIESFQWL
jgi:hypothetical protein